MSGLREMLPLLCAAAVLSADGAAALPRATPESQGVPSSALTNLVARFEAEGDAVHAFMLLRHGRVIASGWRRPYDAATPHAVMSAARTFVALGVGFAAEEGRLTVDDRVRWYFPKEAEANPDPRTRELRVRDLLAMASGQREDAVVAMMTAKDGDQAKAFFAVPMANDPGHFFRYMGGDSALLAQLLVKATGERYLPSYLMPRLFRRLGIDNVWWDLQPDGAAMGFSGLELTTEDFAKCAQLLLQGGVWEGARVVPEGWLRQMTVLQKPYGRLLDPSLIPHAGRQAVFGGPDPANDWQQGYGYQLWMGRYGGYRMDGEYGQLAVVLPAADLVLVTQGGGDGVNGRLLAALYDAVLPVLADGPLSENPAALAALRAQTSRLALACPSERAKPSAAATAVAEKGCDLASNGLGWKRVKFNPGLGILKFENTWGVQAVKVGRNGVWEEGMIESDTHPTVPLSRIRRRAQPVAATGAWESEGVFAIRLCLKRLPFVIDLRLDCTGDRLKFESSCELSARYAYPVAASKRRTTAF